MNIELIEKINDESMKSELCVIESLYDSYDKAYTILENYNGDNMDAFQIFQESKKSKKDEDKDEGFKFRRIDDETGQKESILKSILKLIPRLIQHLKQLIEKRKSQKVTDAQVIAEALKETANIFKHDNRTKKEIYQELTRNGRAMRKYKVVKFFKKLGVVLGGSGIAFFACKDKIYQVNKDTGEIKWIIKDKFTGVVDKVIDDSIGPKIEKLQSSMVDINRKISDISEKILNIENSIKKFFKSAYEKLRKLFHLNIIKDRESLKTEDGHDILFEMNEDEATFTCSLNLDEWNEFVKKSNGFIKATIDYIKGNNESKWTKMEQDETKKIFSSTPLSGEINGISDHINKLIKNKDKTYNIADYQKSSDELMDKVSKLLDVINKGLTESVEKFDTKGDKYKEKIKKMIGDQLLKIVESLTLFQEMDSLIREHIIYSGKLAEVLLSEDKK